MAIGRFDDLIPGFLRELEAITTENDQTVITEKLISLLRNVFCMALQKHGIAMDVATASLELCITGSLARRQATPYSDIDCFLIFDDHIDASIKNQIKEIAQEISQLADQFHQKNRQFMMDPAGVSLTQLSGSVEELTEQISDFEAGNALGFGPRTCSVLNARAISLDLNGEEKTSGVRLSALKQNLIQEKQIVAKHFYDKTLKDYIGPVSNQKINIKDDLMRPVDFILQGLRFEENISVDEYATTEQLLNELVRRQRITPTAKKVFEYVQTETYRHRLALHKAFHREHEDALATDDLKQLVDLVGWLRGSLKQYVDQQSSVFDVVKGVYFSNKKTVPNADQKKLQMEICLEECAANLIPPKPINWKAIGMFIAVGVTLTVLTVFTLGVAGVIGGGIVGGVTFASVMAAGGGAFSSVGAAVGVTVGAHTVATSAAAAAGAHAAATFIGAKIVFFGGLLLAGLGYGVKKLLSKSTRSQEKIGEVQTIKQETPPVSPVSNGDSSYHKYIGPTINNQFSPVEVPSVSHSAPITVNVSSTETPSVARSLTAMPESPRP